MQTVTYETPILYGDHHVLEVRQILLELTGVSEVYASSAFQVIEVVFDPKKIEAEQIKARLEEAGYLGKVSVLVETGFAVQKQGDDAFFRHTAVYETMKSTVSFAQRVDYSGRPLWPCPGFGPVKMIMDE
jgi:copper chaperone CopZ